MKFRQLAEYLERLEATASRNEITRILADLFNKTSAQEIDKVIYLVSGQLAPSYVGLDFNVAEKMMMRIISRAYGVDLGKVKAEFKKKGDLGVVAEEFAKTKGRELSVLEVYGELLQMANEGGGGSQERKVAQMAQLLSSLDPSSVRFVARIPVGNLRLGFSDMTILDALSVMLTGDKSARREIETAFNVTVDVGKIAVQLKEKGLKGIKDVKPVPGVPIRPSLAERLPSAEKMLEKVGATVAVEPKYDGFRAQVHIWNEGGQKIKIYSRNLENTTSMFPDLVTAIAEIKVDSAIFDAESIAFDSKTHKFLPFQETAQRKRKYGIEEAIKRLPLKLFIFDILYKNGVSLLDKPFSERRKILLSTVPTTNGLEVTRQEIVSDPDRIRDLIKEYLSEGLEGALIKKIDASYKAGARGYHWVKYKKTTESGVADTIDCLVMGVNKGKGKRSGFGAGTFLVGVRDGANFKTTSKIGTGLTDVQWRELNKKTQKLRISKAPEEYIVDRNLEPDTWCKPSLVVEILADEITKSPIHAAGLALRFPRLIRFREEKGPKEVTTIAELTNLYKMQKN